MRTFPSMKIFIQKLDRTIGTEKLPVLCVPDEPTLDNIRSGLQDGPLGDVEKDIFFPSWTRSIHVLLLDPEAEEDRVPAWEDIDENKITVEDTEKLLEILTKEEEKPGSTSIILQECRSKRYTRKKDNMAILPFDSSPVSSPVSSRPTSPKIPTGPNMSFSKPKRRQQLNHSVHPHPQEMYNCAPFDPGYYYDPYVAVGIIAPPSIYPPFYPFQFGVGCYNYPSPPPFAPQVYPGYYGYGVM